MVFENDWIFLASPATGEKQNSFRTQKEFRVTIDLEFLSKNESHWVKPCRMRIGHQSFEFDKDRSISGRYSHCSIKQLKMRGQSIIIVAI
jgi:hypothetical protein